MKILFEDFYYDADAIGNILPAELLSWSNDGVLAKTTFVGYHYNLSGNHIAPVFVLPKVFVDQNGRPFGKVGVTKESFLGEDKSLAELLGDEDAQTVSRLSFWLYMAIVRYAERHPETSIIRNRNIQELKSVGEYNCFTLIEIIQSLRKFNHDHQNLFTFIVNSNRSGVNNIHWRRTINKVHPFMQGDEPLYLNLYNKKKNINFDEDLIALFYSVLEYLGEKYYFDESVNINFNLIPTHGIESIIESGMGTIMLNKIRHKYFTDELVQLWHLLYVFFEKAERIVCKDYMEETVLATSFNNVFEDMIDQLIGSNELSSVKKNKDGKIIDHLYKDESLINNGATYFIADSKYYKESSDLGETSVYKQFTYAKNIIQYNLNIFQKGGRGLDSMRDELTEGYNVVPNFFIRGSAIGDFGLYDYEDACLKSEFENDRCDLRNKLVNYHFHNRLFDRDTLILQTYNINFLYVLAKYVEGEDDVLKKKIRNKFREDLIRRFDNLYLFYELTPKGGKTIEELVYMNFRKLLGKVIRTSKDSDCLIFAWEKQGLTTNAASTLTERIQECEDYLRGLEFVEFKQISLKELNGLELAEQDNGASVKSLEYTIGHRVKYEISDDDMWMGKVAETLD